MERTDIVSEIICAKYHYMPDALLLYYAERACTKVEEEVIQQELCMRDFFPPCQCLCTGILYIKTSIHF